MKLEIAKLISVLRALAVTGGILEKFGIGCAHLGPTVNTPLTTDTLM